MSFIIFENKVLPGFSWSRSRCSDTFFYIARNGCRPSGIGIVLLTRSLAPWRARSFEKGKRQTEMASQDYQCAKCGKLWESGQRTCPACGPGSRRAAPKSDYDYRFFRFWVHEESSVRLFNEAAIVTGVLRWLILLPGRLRRFRRNAGLWPKPY